MFGANPNTFGSIPATWNKEYQVIHDKVPVYPAISNYRLASDLKVGDTVHRTYPSTFVANTMGADGSYVTQAATDTDETLAINKVYETSFYVKELDEIQNQLPVRQKYAQRSMVAIFNQIDGDILGQYDQFTKTLDDSDLGGTSGNGITPTVANIKKIFFQAKKKLQKQQILLDNGAKFTGFKPADNMNAMGVAVISPDMYQLLLEAVEGNQSIFGDATGQSGHMGKFAGLNIFVSNALGWSATLDLTTIPVAGDTITINGVVLTAAADNSATNPGDFSIQTTNDLAAAELVALINGTATYGSDTSRDVSAANRLLLKNITASYSASTNLLTLKATGYGQITVSETLTPAGDVWTPALQIQHCLFGVANAIDVVIQKQPSMKIKDAPSAKVGVDVITWTAAGYKVFNEGKARMIDCWIRTDGFSS